MYLISFSIYNIATKFAMRRFLNKMFVCSLEGRWRICSIYDKKIQITQTVCLTTKLWATLETKVREESAIQNLSNEQETKGEGEKSHFIKGWLTIISQTTLRINILLWSHDNIASIRTIKKIRSQLHLLVSNWTVFSTFYVFAYVVV